MKSVDFKYRGHEHGMFLSMFKKRIRVEKQLFVRLPTKRTYDDSKKRFVLPVPGDSREKKYFVTGVDGFSRG